MEKVIKILLCVFGLSPIAAAWQGGVTKHFWINLILWILTFGILGLIHGLWLVLTDQTA